MDDGAYPSRFGLGSLRSRLRSVSGALRLRSLRQLLALLIALALAPLALVAAALLLLQARAETRALERSLTVNAHILSLAVERQMSSFHALLAALAASPYLRDGDLARFHAYASDVARQNDAVFISLFAPDGRQLLNTLRPYGEALPTPFALPPPAANLQEPPLGDATSQRRVVAEKRRSNSNLLRGLVSGRLIFTVDVPVMRGGELAYVLNMAVEPRQFGALVDKTSTSPLARATIIDGNGFIVSRWDERSETIGQRAGATYQAARARSGSFVTRGPSREGEATVFAAHTSAMTGWTAVSAQPEAQPQLSAQNAWRIGAAAALGSLLLGIWLAARFAARITEAIHVLREVAVGRAAPGTINPVAEFVPVHDALARARMLDTAAAQERERLIIAQTREQELEEMARTKDQFIRTLSHELRNPLGAIRNATALLRRGAPMETPLAILERQTDQLMRLVNDLMDASRLALDKVSLEKARHDLRDLLAESVESVQHQFVQRHQACHLQSPEEAIEVEVDASRIRQVLTNLLDNASKYSPPGSTVRATLARNGLMARIEIHDEGVGLDAADLERVFEPFVQAGRRGEATAGLGLGLSIAQHLIRQHGGTIALASPGRGRGAVVTVELPLAGTAAAPVEVPGNLTA